ncbi:hypothetical protein HDN1F_35750 [gamma proteobacterium HdN1]|nr:hypothetical protein HDN1F_35750 [gamma proteobacterium HdN1]
MMYAHSKNHMHKECSPMLSWARSRFTFPSNSRIVRHTPKGRTIITLGGILLGASIATLSHAGDRLEVLDLGGKHRQVILDASKNAFVIGAGDGQLYLYDGANSRAPSANEVYLNAVIALPGVIVQDGKIIDTRNGRTLGEILTDKSPYGSTFYILGYYNGKTPGYLNLDYNNNYRGDLNTPPSAKRDSRIQQVNSLAFVKTYKKLGGNLDWATATRLGIRETSSKISAGTKLLRYNFSVPKNGSYQVLLRGFNGRYNDLNLRVVEMANGRVMGSSFSDATSELVTANLEANRTYGIIVSRTNDLDTVNFKLNIKSVTEQANRLSDLDSNEVPPLWIDALWPEETRTITGTLRPTTPSEYVPRFIDIRSAQGDKYAGKFGPPLVDDGSIDSDTLFTATRKLLTSWFATPPYTVADRDAYMFFGDLANYDITITSRGGTPLTYTYNYWNDTYQERVGNGKISAAFNYGPQLLTIGDLLNHNVAPYNYSVSTDTIEYEITLKPNQAGQSR